MKSNQFELENFLIIQTLNTYKVYFIFIASAKS